MNDYTSGGAGAGGAALAATGAYGSGQAVLLVGLLLMAGALLSLGVSAHRRRADRRATRV